MAHSIILMNEKLDELDGESTSGRINELRQAVNETDANIPTLSKPLATAAHAKMEQIQEWLVDDSTSSAGAADAVAQFVADLEPYR